MGTEEPPVFTTDSERVVWEHLRDQLDDDDLLVPNLRLTDRKQDHELDFLVGLTGHGFVVLEVKGSVVRCESDGTWTQPWNNGRRVVDPVGQARNGMYAVRQYADNDDRWQSRRVRWAHAVVLPFTEVDEAFATPECPRWAIAGRRDMPGLVAQLRDLLDRQHTSKPAASKADIADLREILRGRTHPQADLVVAAAEHEASIDRLTQQQAIVLDAIKLLNRVEIRGGAGSGKTWLALEQARRLSHDGERFVRSKLFGGYLAGATVRLACAARAPRAASAKAASRLCWSPGCTMPADINSVIAASTVMSRSMMSRRAT